jgi:orotate phosphoribosyltransferase
MPQDLLSVFKERRAILDGHFLLSSGLHSPQYLQCALVLMDPELATRLGRELADVLRPVLAEPPQAVVAPAMGGVLVAHEVARAFGVRGLFTERQDGIMTLRRGFQMTPGEPVVVVEDALTTGRSTREVLEVMQAQQVRVLAVGTLVDRTLGDVDLGVPRRSLLRLEVPAYPRAECPACAEGSTPVKPGSRGL